MLKRSMLKAPPGSKTRVVRSARSLPGATASAATVASMRAWPVGSRLPSKTFWRSVSYFRVGSSKTYSSKRLNDVRAGERASSTSALRLRAGAPWSHADAQDAGDAALRAELVRPEVHRDLEPVGHHRLDLERLVERRPADAHAPRVVAGGGVGRGGDLERVEAVGRLGARHGPDELAARVHEVEAHRVVRGEALRGVVEDEHEVHRVAGSPDPALAVEEALEAPGRPRAGHVEVGHRQGGAAVEAQVAGLPRVSHGGEERRPLHRDPGDAVAVGPGGAERLLLVVEERHLRPRDGLGGAQVVGEDDDGVVLAGLGHQAEVGDEHVARGADVVVVEALVVGGVAGVVAVLEALVPVAPLVLLPGVPVALLLLVVLGCEPAAPPRAPPAPWQGHATCGRRKESVSRYMPPGLFARSGDTSSPTGSQRFSLSAVSSSDSVFLQTTRPTRWSSCSPSRAFVWRNCGMLEEGTCKRLHRDRAQVHRLDRDGEAGGGRHDDALAREAHRGLEQLELHGELAGLLHPVAEHVAHARLDPHRLLAAPALRAVDLETAPVGHEAKVVAVPDPDEALQVLARLEGIGEAQLDVRLRGDDHARLVHGERVEPRHRDLPRLLAVHPDGAAVPAQAEGGGRLRALDPAHGEGVDPTVRLVGPGDGQLAAGEGRPQHLLDPGGLLDVGGHQPAGERLALDVGRVGGLQPVHRDVEGLAHGGEDEVEARERRLPGGQQGGEVEARRVGLAVGQPLRRAELDAVGGGPDRRALDPRLEAEGRGVEGRADLLGAGRRPRGRPRGSGSRARSCRS